MSEHRATIRWQNSGATLDYDHFSRDHTWTVKEGRLTVPASSAPALLTLMVSRVEKRRTSPRASPEAMSWAVLMRPVRTKSPPEPVKFPPLVKTSPLMVSEPASSLSESAVRVRSPPSAASCSA